MGTLKLTPAVNEDVYREMVNFYDKDLKRSHAPWLFNMQFKFRPFQERAIRYVCGLSVSNYSRPRLIQSKNTSLVRYCVCVSEPREKVRIRRNYTN